MRSKRKAKRAAIVCERRRLGRARRFAKRRKPSKQNEKKHIHSLPEEVMYKVFDLLNLEDVKAASLTCRRWNDIIFFSRYTNRFTLNMELVQDDPRSRRPPRDNIFTRAYIQWENTQAKEALRIVTGSQRSYRAVRCTTNSNQSLSHPRIFAAIHQKFGSTLNTLEIDFYLDSMGSFFPWVIETIPLMPQLETLKLDDGTCRTKFQDVKPILRSESLKHFVMKANVKILVDMPRLQTFDGPLLILDRHDDSLQQLPVPSLKHLSIRMATFRTDAHSVTRELTIIRLLPPIETIIWDAYLLNEKKFLAMCKSCTKLTDLTIKGDLYLSDISVFSHLEKLTNLRSLSVGYLLFQPPMHLDFSPLTTLEKLAIGDPGVVSLILPESVKSLQLVIDNKNTRSMIETILSRRLQLIELAVYFVFDNSGKDMLIETWKILPQLRNLKVHKFYSALYRKLRLHRNEDINNREDTLRNHKFRIGFIRPMHDDQLLGYIRD